MNYSILTPKELINRADPQTDLEKALLAALVDSDRECISLSREVSELNLQLENAASEDEIYDLRKSIKDAIKILEAAA